MKHVKATGLSSVFWGLNPVTFTDEAKNKGVTNTSIIYIKCVKGDEKYGEQFVPGSTWIWAQGEWFANYSRPITEEEIEEIVFESGVFPDIPNFGGRSAVTYIQDMTTSTDTSFTLEPNYKYLFGERTSLTITLGEITDPAIVNHYMFEFTSGSTATTLSLPPSIKWTTEPSIKPNKIYQISIENNLGVIQEWT